MGFLDEETRKERVVSRVFRQAWSEVFDNTGALAAVLLVPVIFWVTLGLAQLPLDKPWTYLLTLAEEVSYAVIAFRTYRFILARDQLDVRALEAKTFLGFLLIAGSIFICTFAIAVGLIVATIRFELEGKVSFFGAFFGVILCSYLPARLSLMLPDRALGRSATLREAWRWSRGLGLRIAIVLVAPPFVAEALMRLVENAVPGMAAALFRTAVAIPVLVLEIAIVSVAYREFRNEK